MTRDQKQQIGFLLKGAYPPLFKEDDSVMVWVNALIDLDGDDTIRAINEYMQEETQYPSIAVIRQRSLAITKQRNDLMNAPVHESEYFCDRCKDTGWTFWESPTGIALSSPCNCTAGKKTYYAKSEEERRKIDFEELKKGRNTIKIMTAPKNFYEEYVYGKTSQTQQKQGTVNSGVDGTKSRMQDVARRLLEGSKENEK